MLNGLLLAGRMPSCPRPCCYGSGGDRPDRRHQFWECPVAAAVLDSLSAKLGGRSLSPAQLWLATPPLGVHQGVWEVVCLAGLAAMDSGPRLVEARRRQPPHTTALLPRPAHPGCGSPLCGRFWALSHDCCAAGSVPTGWRSKVQSTGPFLRWHSQTQRWQPTRSSPQHSALCLYNFMVSHYCTGLQLIDSNRKFNQAPVRQRC